MSPWLREPLQIVLAPDRVTWQSPGRRLALRAADRLPGAPRSVQVAAADGGAPWQPALAALESALPAALGGRAVATVVLSNQFLRYALVPWRDELAGVDENLSYARHCLAKVYGQPARAWEIRLAQQAPGQPRLASAVDAELLEGLRGVLQRADVRVRSIQPHLMAACNGARRQLRRRSAWLALLEPGHLTLARLQQGRWASLRSQRLDGRWRDELVPILEREALFADDEAVPREVCLGCLGDSDEPLPEAREWQFHALQCAPQAAARVPQDEPAALAAAVAG